MKAKIKPHKAEIHPLLAGIVIISLCIATAYLQTLNF